MSARPAEEFFKRGPAPGLQRADHCKMGSRGDRRRRHDVGMPEFIDPTARLRASFLGAVAEFRADRDYPVPWFVDDVDRPALSDQAAFDAYLARLRSDIAAPSFQHRPGQDQIARPSPSRR
jgi:hypothetical protein